MGRAISRVLDGVDVRAVTGGSDALRLVRGGERFDVILCDILMPEMTGGEVYAGIAEQAREQADRIIFMTGEPDGPVAGGLLAQVPNPCLPKPLRAEQLVPLVRTYLS